jgi:hypothetical protein
MNKRYYGVFEYESLRMSILDIVRGPCAEENRVRWVQGTLQRHAIDAVDKVGRVPCHAIVWSKVAQFSNQIITEHVISVKGENPIAQSRCDIEPRIPLTGVAIEFALVK